MEKPHLLFADYKRVMLDVCDATAYKHSVFSQVFDDVKPLDTIRVHSRRSMDKISLNTPPSHGPAAAGTRLRRQ